MHELAVCQALVTQVEAIVREHAARRVTRIELQVGPLSGVEPRLLEQAFPVASAGTACAGAALVIDSLPIGVRCTRCGQVTAALPNRLLCAACGDWRTVVESGDELLLSRVELDREHAGGNSEQPEEQDTCVTPAAAT